MCAGLPGGTPVSCSMTLIGSATNTGPAGASLATLKARCRIGPNSPACSTCTLHLVTGAAMATRSWPSTGSRSLSRVSCWPAVTTRGEPVLQRAVDHADGVAQAGRHMQVHEAGLAAGLRIEVRGAHGHAFVQVHDVLQLRIVEQRIEQRTFGRAGIAEDAIDAVGQKRLHEHLTAAHASIPSNLLLGMGKRTSLSRTIGRETP